MGIGQKNDFVGAEYGRCFRHEMNPTEDDYIGMGPGSVLAQLQGIADKIRYILDFTQLVVMGEDNGVSRLLEFQNSLDQ